jgi:hypothetical protein
MAIADSKKFQTAVNLLHTRVAQPVANAATVAAVIRQAIIDNGLQGQLTAGQQTALGTFVTDLETLAASPIIAALAAKYAATHRDTALTIVGVND